MFEAHWVYSITTRIKTLLQSFVELDSHWVYSITTRIKTNYIIFVTVLLCSCLIEYIPLQQGLRQNKLSDLLNHIVSHWVYSITTRIKTFVFHRFILFFTHWVYSITTRIKTPIPFAELLAINLIEYIPLQQGLRLLNT